MRVRIAAAIITVLAGGLVWVAAKLTEFGIHVGALLLAANEPEPPDPSDGGHDER
jgi:hypothetical protein